MNIDLRSDTVTRPSPAMLEAMMQAKVGDDVYNEDPSVNELQELSAAMFGKEAALFCPSGTMTNQIAIRIHTQPGDELICGDNSHVYKYEGGGIASNSGVQARIIQGDRGRITAAQIEEVINADDIHFPVSKLVCLENTSNRGGGSVYDPKQILAIRRLCDAKGMILHLDGARIFNALAEGGHSAKDMGASFDTISICLSKSLGAPVGSVLLGSKEMIARAKRVRKVFGGGMRQAGFMAAAGIYALRNNITRLKDDHAKARQAEQVLKETLPEISVMPVETNIVIFRFPSPACAEKFHAYLNANNILCGKISADSLRFVFHLDILEEQRLCEVIAAFRA